MRKIERISESPCSKCGFIIECSNKIRSNCNLEVIKDMVFGNKDYDFKQCPLWIAFNCRELVDES